MPKIKDTPEAFTPPHKILELMDPTITDQITHPQDAIILGKLRWGPKGWETSSVTLQSNGYRIDLSTQTP